MERQNRCGHDERSVEHPVAELVITWPVSINRLRTAALFAAFEPVRSDRIHRNERGLREELIEYLLGHEGSYNGDTSDSQPLATYVPTCHEDNQDTSITEIYKFGLGF